MGKNTNESLTLRKEFISDQKNEYITCRTLLHRVYIEKKITGVNYLILISSLTILLDILMIFTCTELSLSIFFSGAGLMGFYRLHLLEIVTVEFLIVPLLMVVGGTFAFFTAVFGFYAASKEDACLLITHAVFMSINFCILLAAIISSIRLIFYIQTGLFEANVTEDMNLYEIDSWVRYRWDTLQCKCIHSVIYAKGDNTYFC